MKYNPKEMSLEQRQSLDLILWIIVMCLLPSLYVAFLQYKKYVFFILIFLIITVYCLIKNNKKGLQLEKEKKKEEK